MPYLEQQDDDDDDSKEEAKAQTALVTVYCRQGIDPPDESWHKAVDEIVHKEFGGVQTLWNSSWKEYKIWRADVQTFAETLKKRGHSVSTESENDDDDAD